MVSANPNLLLTRAEQAFRAGSLGEARRLLRELQCTVGEHPAVLHLLALVEKKRGALDAARIAFGRALDLDPRNPEIATNAGNFYRSQGEYEAAMRSYDQALAARPGDQAALLGRAFCLSTLGRIDDARVVYRHAAERAPANHSPWSELGALERQVGELSLAAHAFDEALKRSPSAPVAVHGRARVALERGEQDAHHRFIEAERLLPNDPHVALGSAEAWVTVDQSRAMEMMKAVAMRFPEWPDPQFALAKLRWERGNHEYFCEGIEDAVAEQPRNAAMWNALIEALSGVDQHRQAAEAAARAYAVLGRNEFLLLEAANASTAGEIERADLLFAKLALMRGSELAQAQHALKKGELERAAALLDTARKVAPDDIAVWAWTGLVWRLTGDPRTEWLYQIDRFVSVERNAIDPLDLDKVAECTAALHHARNFPIGQSLRGGSQTRGRLLDRADECLQRFRRRMAEIVQAHWENLPSEDSTHPLLRHRARRPRFAGSWSVRLRDEGYHLAHIHPRGLLSSACYLRIPARTHGQAGWLELGGAPSTAGADLPPLLQIRPTPGALALFPSFLFHGTVPFATGERLTIAFDVTV